MSEGSECSYLVNNLSEVTSKSDLSQHLVNNLSEVTSKNDLSQHLDL